MRYISTRGTAPILSFEEAMLTGLARDGGLYVPETIPQLSPDQIAAMGGQSYEEVAFAVMRPFIGDTFTDAEFRDLIAKAYAGFGHGARAPLVQLAPGHFLLELFHGPTLAFKDVGARFMARTMGACRPTGDRLRESLFSVVGAAVAGTRVWDACAGTGGDTDAGILHRSRRLGHPGGARRWHAPCDTLRRLARGAHHGDPRRGMDTPGAQRGTGGFYRQAFVFLSPGGEGKSQRDSAFLSTTQANSASIPSKTT